MYTMVPGMSEMNLRGLLGARGVRPHQLHAYHHSQYTIHMCNCPNSFVELIQSRDHMTTYTETYLGTTTLTISDKYATIGLMRVCVDTFDSLHTKRNRFIPTYWLDRCLHYNNDST